MLLNTDIKLNTNNEVNTDSKPYPLQEKVSNFFEHHKKQLMETRKHADPDLHLVDKLGTLIDWSIETYEKILKAKKNSKWDVRRNQPNTAKWLLATMDNENLEQEKVISLKRKTYSAEEHKRIKEEYERSRNAS